MKYLVLSILILLFMIIVSSKETFNNKNTNSINNSQEIKTMLENYRVSNFDRNLSFHQLNTTILKHLKRLSNLNFLNI